MKQLFFILIFFATATTFAQFELTKSEVRTSDQEYNFLTVQHTLDDNIQMLPGYELKSFKKVAIDNYNFEYKFLVDTKSNQVRAIAITATKLKKKEDKIKYLCLPINNEALYKDFKTQSYEIGLTMGEVMTDINTSLLVNFVDEKYNN